MIPLYKKKQSSNQLGTFKTLTNIVLKKTMGPNSIFATALSHDSSKDVCGLKGCEHFLRL